MKHQFHLLAATAATTAVLLAACSSDDELTDGIAAQDQAPSAIAFEATTQRALVGETRAGDAGEITTTVLQSKGFGVFGYYTDNVDYDQFNKPNFMYNEKVTYSGSAWTYTTTKYWPNEYGSQAISDDVDKVSFFAYAPWVEVTPSSGAVTGDKTSGITALSRNSANGDPLVKYVADLDPTKCVDLLWGVIKEDTSWPLVNGGTQSLTAGYPWLNIQRPTATTPATEKVKFYFQHALAKLNVQIDTDVDITTHKDDDDGPATGTKVYVRSVTFTGFATKGTLDLNNTTANKPLWLDYAGVSELGGDEYTIYDGRKDGKEGYIDGEQSNEKVKGLNDDLIQTNTATTGVTKELKNLFKSTTLTDPVLVIPTDEAVTVTIVYDIETADANLATRLSDGTTPGSSIENRIKKTVQISSADMKLEPGKSYTLKLHLGLRTVEFDAEVNETWTDGGTGEAWLPGNAN